MKNFGIITRNYLGKPFSECNCLQLIYNICNDLGVELKQFKKLYKGHSIDNCLQYWKKDPTNAIKDMIEVLKTVGTEADIRFPARGDIIVAECRGNIFPGIYTGCNTIIVATERKGVVVLGIGKGIKTIMIRRVF